MLTKKQIKVQLLLAKVQLLLAEVQLLLGKYSCCAALSEFADPQLQ